MDLSQDVFVIGMRGAGKSTVGKALAEEIGYDFCDLDDELEKEVGMSVSELVVKEGWEYFRDLEERMLKEKVEIKGDKLKVYSTGGGCIIRENSLKLLEEQKNVIQVLTPIHEIIKYLTQADSDKSQRPDFGASIEETYNQRKSKYYQASSFDFCWNPRKDMSKLARLVADFAHRTTAPHLPNFANINPNTIPFIPCLRVSTTPKFCKQTRPVDGILFPQPTLSETTSEPDKLIEIQMKLSSSKNSVLFPLVIYCETEPSKTYIDACLRFGVEYIVILADSLLESSVSLSGRYMTRILRVPKIVFLDLDSVNKTYEKKDYFLFGCPISKSPSPTLHNNIFKFTEKKSISCSNIFVGTISEPWEFSEKNGDLIKTHISADNHPNKSYHLFETKDFQVLKNYIEMPSFKGASVTIPHKENFFNILSSKGDDYLSDSAKKIGAVNTLFRKNGEIHGENTDWIGIRDVLAPSIATAKTALVIGAGGTARSAIYALRHHFQLNVLVYNRTVRKAKLLAEEFEIELVTDLNDLTLKLDVIVGTIPAMSQFKIPEGLVGTIVSKDTVFLDAAYKPEMTALLLQARNLGAQFHTGLEMLIAQGFEQARIWSPELEELELKKAAEDAQVEVKRFYAST